jgi:hypothetical protein
VRGKHVLSRVKVLLAEGGNEMGRAQTGLIAAGAVVALASLTGCFADGGSSSATTALTPTPTTGVSAVSPALAITLGHQACQEYTAAVAAANTAIAYPDLFEGDAEADQAEHLDPSIAIWTQLASTFDTVKSQLQAIDSLQGSSQSYSTSPANAASLSQAVGTLRGDLSAVQILCAADRL